MARRPEAFRHKLVASPRYFLVGKDHRFTHRWAGVSWCGGGIVMARKILCVAEKPAIARAVATHLSGGSFQTVSASDTHRDAQRLRQSAAFDPWQSICQEL